MKRDYQQVSGTMDISTRKNLNIICGLLETLSNLQITYALDSIYTDDKDDIIVHYVEGRYGS